MPPAFSESEKMDERESLCRDGDGPQARDILFARVPDLLLFLPKSFHCMPVK